MTWSSTSADEARRSGDPANRVMPLPHFPSLRIPAGPVLGESLLVEGFDIFERGFHGPHLCKRQPFGGGGERSGAHAEIPRPQLGSIKFFGIPDNRGVTVLLHIPQNRSHA